MAQLDPVNPALAQVIGAMDVINPVTPDGKNVTVAAKVMQAAQQAMPPQPQMPNVQQIAQDAGVGGQIQMQQQQAQQQEMMQMMQQMMQQRQAQDNAMRFGVAAAPGAQGVRMAEGGIVGYAAGNPEPHPLNDPEALREARERLERLRRRAAAQSAFGSAPPPAAPAAAQAAGGRGVGALLRGVGAKALGPAAALYGVYDALKDPESRAATEDNILKMLGFREGMPFRPAEAPYSNEGRANLLEREGYSNEGRNYPAGSELRSGIAEAAAAGGADIEMPPRAAPGAGILQIPMPTAPVGRSREYQTKIEDLVKGYEVEGPKGADVQRRIAENTEITNAALRAAGLKPDQRALDEAESQARQTRREEGIAGLRKASEEARGGINRTIALLSAAANSSNPLAMIGIRHGQLVAQDLAENERFTNSLERIRTEGEIERVALREKARAEVIGDVKTAREQEAKIVEARNKRREAEIGAATEFYKAERKSEEGALDRQTQIAIKNMELRVTQMASQGLKEAEQFRRIEEYATKERNNIERNYRAAVRDLGILRPTNPSPEEQRALNRLEAERDAAMAKLDIATTELRSRIAGGTSGGNIKVERTK